MKKNLVEINWGNNKKIAYIYLYTSVYESFYICIFFFIPKALWYYWEIIDVPWEVLWPILIKYLNRIRYQNLKLHILFRLCYSFCFPSRYDLRRPKPIN